ncbi:MAG: signal peptidase I [Clostridia bacterium]|nr:signal peptidase I [Clostridia bacterium]
MSGESLPLRRENCRKLHRQHTVWRWTFSTVLAALFMIFVCFVWFSWARIGNDSMAPTLKKGDLVLVDRIYKYCYEIERTDMVAYRRPGTGELLIKRVVATGGETVSGQNGSLWIDEKYRLNEDEYGPVNTADFDAVTVPKGYVFVLSDDRQYLEDSREEDIGCVALDDIVGVMHVRISPSFQIYQ